MPFSIDSLNLSDETLSVRYRRNLFINQIDCLYPEDCFYVDAVCGYINDCIDLGGVFIRLMDHDNITELDRNKFRDLDLDERLGQYTDHDAWVYSYAMWSERDEWFLLSDQLAESFALSATKDVWEKVYGASYESELKKRFSDFQEFVSKVWVGLTVQERQAIIGKYAMICSEGGNF